MQRRALASFSVATGLALLFGCKPSLSDSAQRGRALIASAGCGSCHEIPGVRGANGRVGPPLDSIAQRTYIAGELPNTTQNLARWVENAPAIEPRTAMPNLGLSSEQSRDIAAYLETLE